MDDSRVKELACKAEGIINGQDQDYEQGIFTDKRQRHEIIAEAIRTALKESEVLSESRYQLNVSCLDRIDKLERELSVARENLKNRSIDGGFLEGFAIAPNPPKTPHSRDRVKPRLPREDLPPPTED